MTGSTLPVAEFEKPLDVVDFINTAVLDEGSDWPRPMLPGDVINIIGVKPVVHGQTFIVATEATALPFKFPTCQPHQRKQSSLMLVPLQKRFAVFRYRDHDQ